MANSKDTYYSVLGVSETATPREVRSAYRALLKKLHPDTVATLSDDLRREAECVTQQIIEAYLVLADPRQRDIYNRHLASQRKQSITASTVPNSATGTRSHISTRTSSASKTPRPKKTGGHWESLGCAMLTILILGVFAPFLIMAVTVDEDSFTLSFVLVEIVFLLSQIWLQDRIYSKSSRKERGADGWMSGVLISILMNALYTIVAIVSLLSTPDQDSKVSGQSFVAHSHSELKTAPII
jgi:hypothetical protein